MTVLRKSTRYRSDRGHPQHGRHLPSRPWMGPGTRSKNPAMSMRPAGVARYARRRKHQLHAAAHDLGASPPAIIRRLAELEEGLGVKLADRSGRLFRLTDGGTI
jgi:hypothetical protein